MHCGRESKTKFRIIDAQCAVLAFHSECCLRSCVYLGLTKNKSDIQPDTLHGDTQAQSAPVYGLVFFLGIKLMPRIRNWKDLKWFRPTTDEVYQHIDD
jgi:TnpA family transposase